MSLNKNAQASEDFLTGTVVVPSGIPAPEWNLQKTNRNFTSIAKAGMDVIDETLGTTLAEKTRGDSARHMRFCVKAGMRRPGCSVCGGRKPGDR